MNLSTKINFPENISEFIANTGIVDNAKDMLKKAEGTFARFTAGSNTTTNVVTNEIEFGKHTVRVNGVVIDAFWRKKPADELADKLRVALGL